MTSSKDHKPRERSTAAHTNPGVHTDRKANEIRSRSEDPGQSSYGGFKNENPGKQHQSTPDTPPKRQR